ncbi:TM2 domain-containing protein [Marinobacter adhaerens]|uniref:TM2 domain-containing protein n=1 Tax=Marinobacter adhaerens TaxID=1033846 RepID=A0A851HV40_9GAMM|nr:TM2 domain-containing protein [Marinobacter adhaerens]
MNHPKQKNRLITLVLAMVLGIFGVDRCYLGKWERLREKCTERILLQQQKYEAL